MTSNSSEQKGSSSALTGKSARSRWQPWALGLLSLLAAFCLAACGAKPRPGVAPRHLLLISVEHLRADHVSSLGYDRRTTDLLRPDRLQVLDLDLIATRGVSFARAFAPSASNSISLASLLGWPLNVEGKLGEGPSLAASFQSAGFRSSCFVTRTSLDQEHASSVGLGRGFEQAGFFDSDEETLTAAVQWLKREVPAGQRHFTWLHLASIQPPFEGQPFSDRYSAADAESAGSASEFVGHLQDGTRDLDPEARRHLIDLYDGRLQRVVELLNSFFFLYAKEFGRGPEGNGEMWDESLIAVLGSSGCELAERGRQIGGDGSLCDEGLRVPLFLSHPLSLTGERILSEPVELADVGATMRDWFGLSLPEGASGRSLLALTDSHVKREFQSWPALAIAPGVGYSLRSARYRLIVRDAVPQLFDLDMDPAARRDVAASSSRVLDELLESSRARIEGLGLRYPR